MVQPVLRALVLLLVGLISSAYAFNPLSDNNLVNYWGQNSLGAAGADMRLWQKPLVEYCQSSKGENVIVLAFLHVFNSASRGLPRMDLSNQCDPSKVFPGTSLLHCPRTGDGVKMCQSKGKAVLLSLGGAAGAYGFSTDAEARDFAHMIWNLFLGGSSATRPVDDAILDGVDLDIEGGSPLGYTAFIAELRLLFATDRRKQYYISAAPQCPFPDAYLGATLQTAWVDMVFVQFYNNYCGTQAYGSFNFNYEQWDNWAKTTSINKNVRIYLGVPASRTAANAGYVTPERLGEIIDTLRCKYSSFGGVMMWDTSQAYGNIDSTGVQYSVAADRRLKRPRNIVCGDQDRKPTALLPTSSAPASTPTPTLVQDTSTLEDVQSASMPVQSTPTTEQTTRPAKEPVASVEPLSPTLSSFAPTSPSTKTLSSPWPSSDASDISFSSMTIEMTLVSVSSSPSTSLSPVVEIPPVALLSEPKMDPMPSESRQRRVESMCPIEGGKCQISPSKFVCDGYQFAVCIHGHWILRTCAAGTFCTLQGCDFIRGPVKTCRDLEEFSGMRSTRQQMREVVERMWNVFGSTVDSSWASYIGADQSSGHGEQHAFGAPVPLGTGKDDDIDGTQSSGEPFLIDFIELDASQEFVSFAIDPERQNETTFRTQVRIRTNANAISPLWRVSFYVNPGQVVRSSSRGTFNQQGLHVSVGSKPSEEVEHSMVVRFVIEGIKSVPPIGSSNSDEDLQPAEAQGIFAASSLPHSGSAKFETEPYPLD